MLRALCLCLMIVLLAGCGPGYAAEATSIPSPAYTATRPSPTATVTATATEPPPTFTPQPSDTPGPTPTPVATQTALPRLPAGRPVSLVSMRMIDSETGWALDQVGHILRTADGGFTWKDVTPRQGSYVEGGFFALDAESAWATPIEPGCVSADCPERPNFTTIWRTADGGTTWQGHSLCLGGGDCGYSYAISPDYFAPVALQFVDDESGWMLVSVAHLMFQDRYRLYSSADGGQTWEMVVDSMGGPTIFSATGLAFLDSQAGWLGEDSIGSAFEPSTSASLSQNLDSGLNWDGVDLPPPQDLPATNSDPYSQWCGTLDIHAAPPIILQATVHCRVGDVEPRQMYYYFYRSLDRGETWAYWPVAGYRAPNVWNRWVVRTASAEFVDALTGWRLVPAADDGPSELLATLDGGRTWDLIKSVTWESARLDFVDAQAGWAIAVNGEETALVRTMDGGLTWEDLRPVIGP